MYKNILYLEMRKITEEMQALNFGLMVKWII
jgi:hypothetical protein